MCAAWSIFDGMPPTESLPHWTHLLGLAMLLVISAGIWYNLRGISKRFPLMIARPQRWFAATTIAALVVSLGFIGYDVFIQERTSVPSPRPLLTWSSIAVAALNGIWYGISLRSLLGHSENTREQLIENSF
jgi:hypothetical protein